MSAASKTLRPLKFIGAVLACLVVAVCISVGSGAHASALDKRSGTGFGRAQPAWPPNIESIYPLTNSQQKAAYFYELAGKLKADCMCAKVKEVSTAVGQRDFSCTVFPFTHTWLLFFLILLAHDSQSLSPYSPPLPPNIANSLKQRLLKLSAYY